MSTADDRCRRAGFTVLEAIVAVVVSVIVVIVAIPLLYRGTQALRRSGCAYNLRALGQALDAYQTAHSGAFPCGARYQMSPESPWGPSWWTELLPYVAQDGGKMHWEQVRCSGDFGGEEVNPNLKLVDGLLPTVMRCPASSLPPLSDPNKTYSQANRDSLDHPAKGVALPDYVALAGSAPDMMNIRPDQSVIGPHGRNTRDGPWGILSGSGAFPPNQAMRHASLRDGVGNVIIVGEQSTWGIDPYYNPPLQYDLRSSFPDGGYKGAGGNYGGLNPEAEGINGSGDDRCFNITTVRYAINAVTLDAEKLPKGIVANPIGPPPRLPRDKKPKNIPQHPTGPGHNHGIFSVHVGGANVLFGDGHVEFKSEQMDLPTLQMLVTRDDGHVAKK